MKENKRFEITSMALHIMAMVFMLCDHLWATIVPGNDWLTCIGRLAFPIFAFLIVEGYFHTGNLKKYVGRLLIFAILSELPFNLVMGGSAFYWPHQNVLWTFLIGIGLVHFNELARKNGHLWVRGVTCLATLALGFILGLVTFVDYHYVGVYTVLVFYFFRGRKWRHFLGQLVLLAYLNIEVLSGFTYELQLLGHTVPFVRQGLALLALIPIWLYRGKQGPHSKALQYTYYAFYPVHLLVLWLLMRL